MKQLGLVMKKKDLLSGWVQNEDRRPKTQKRRPRQNRLKTLEKG